MKQYFIACSLLLTAGAANAATLPDAQYYAGINASGFDAFGNYTNVGKTLTGPGGVSINTFGMRVEAGIIGSIPTVSVDVHNINFLMGGSGSVSIDYFVKFFGPTVTVPVRVQGIGLAIGDIAVSSFLRMTGATSGLIFDMEACSYCTFASNSFSLNKEFVFDTVQTYGVQLQTAFSLSGRGTMRGLVDPYFILPDGYSIELSPGIGNAALGAVPLPAALPLFATALAGFGLVGWRRRRSA